MFLTIHNKRTIATTYQFGPIKCIYTFMYAKDEEETNQ